MKNSCFAILLLIYSLHVSAADTTVVKSPNGAIAFKLFQQNRQLYFNVVFLGKTVIATSPMFLSVDGTSVTQNITVGKTERSSHSET